MADKKKLKRRKDEYGSGAEGIDDKPSKDEFQVAKWIKKNVPTKKTKFLNHNVEYFSATKTLDALMSSKFAKDEPCLFVTRESAIEFLDTMLIHRFFHRARKVPVTEAELKRSKKSNNDDETGHKKDKDDGAKVSTGEAGDTGNETATKDSGDKLKEKKKRKIRLDMHPDQVFVDGPEAYVWIYDPIPMHYWLFGALLVVGAIVVCLFPLWPPVVKKGVHYLSILAVGFLVSILGLAVIRFIVFCMVWTATGGKHHFWLLPNLTEDVGFFASFVPLYKHEYKENDNKGSKKPKKKKKDKDSDAEEDNVSMVSQESKIDEPVSKELLHNEPLPEKLSNEKEILISAVENAVPEEPKATRKDSSTPSESESEGSQRSSTGKDFEMVDSAEVDTS